MFDKEFYPTPHRLLEKIGADAYEKVVLEPSAGKGNIVDWLKSNGAKEVISCEKNAELREILKSKCRVIKEDFFELNSSDVSHINMIYMNPPFSNQEKHITHAFDIAPDGCEIISICGSNISYGNTQTSRQIESLVNNYGEIVKLGQEFQDAERKTGVETSFVRLFKPISSSDYGFEGFFEEEEPEGSDVEGVMSYNEIRSIVNTYVSAVKHFDSFRDTLSSLNSLGGAFGVNVSLSVGHNESIVSKEDYAKMLQKRAWKRVFDLMNLKKFVTSGVMKKINKFVETQQKYPFTMKNIYKMIDVIVGTREQTMNAALEEVMDSFTKHTHENRWNVEGWKTNSGYMLNRKFIVDRCAELNWTNGIGVKEYYGNFDKVVDLNKVLCNLTGKDFNKIPSIELASCDLNEDGYLTEKGSRVKDIMQTPFGDKILNRNQFESNKWYSWGFFDFKVFKKGTMHMKFKDEKDWYALNKAYGALKGFTLPEK